jgi:hypothetical protein
MASAQKVQVRTNDNQVLLKDARSHLIQQVCKDELIAVEVTSLPKTTPVVEEVPVATVSPVKALTKTNSRLSWRCRSHWSAAPQGRADFCCSLVTSASKTTPVVEEVPVATVRACQGVDQRPTKPLLKRCRSHWLQQAPQGRAD